MTPLGRRHVFALEATHPIRPAREAADTEKESTMTYELGLLCRGSSPWPHIHHLSPRRARPRRGDWHRLDPMPGPALRPGNSARSAAIGVAILAGLILGAEWIEHRQSGNASATSLIAAR